MTEQKKVKIIKKYIGFNYTDEAEIGYDRALDLLMLIPILSNFIWIIYLLARKKETFIEEIV